MLQFAISQGIINVQDIQNQIDMKKDEKILSEHKYSIWQGKNGKWYTYLPDDEKGKVLKKRNTESEIKKVVVQYYKDLEVDPLVKDVFKQWSEYKLNMGEISKATYDRYARDYIRYIKGKDIENLKIKSLTEIYLEDFIRTSIKEFNLTSKAYAGLRLILRGMLIYAKKRGFTKISAHEFFGDLDLSRTIFKKNIKEKETQVFSEEEQEIIMKYLSDNPSLINYGIMLVFQTGLRVGELCTLKFTDIVGQKLRVRRTETRYTDENGVFRRYVKEFPKTDAGWREVFLTPKSLWIIKKLKEYDNGAEFIFDKDGEWIFETSFDYHIEKACKKCNIIPKSMHKIRKTYGTTLINGNVDESIIAEQMGHSDIKCTKQYYYYSNRDNKKKEEQLSKALSMQL